MTLQALSLGFGIDVWRPRCGVVHSAFDHALNLLLDGELWTVLAAMLPDAPFGIRLAPGDRLVALDARPDDRVHVKAGYVAIGRQVVDCRVTTRWSKAQWGTPAAGLPLRLSMLERLTQAQAWPGSVELARDLTAALCDSDAELARAVRRCVGRGPGLTPSGDDVLVGMLAVLTSGTAGAFAERAALRLRRALVPVLHSTPEISRHLLDQAARGLPGRALHELGKAVCEGLPDDILLDALARVLDTGSSSGADACVGMVAAFCLSFSSNESIAS